MLDACGQPREPPDLFVIARHFDVIAERLCTGGEGSAARPIRAAISLFRVLTLRQFMVWCLTVLPDRRGAPG
jgi:hypothetical protein